MIITIYFLLLKTFTFLNKNKKIFNTINKLIGQTGENHFSVDKK